MLQPENELRKKLIVDCVKSKHSENHVHIFTAAEDIRL